MQEKYTHVVSRCSGLNSYVPFHHRPKGPQRVGERLVIRGGVLKERLGKKCGEIRCQFSNRCSTPTRCIVTRGGIRNSGTEVADPKP
jgi:hypothetical protein